MLIDRCLAGEAGAWDELYERYHNPLQAAIRATCAVGHRDPEFVEEIAARVWYAVVADGGSLLDRYDVSRGGRLITYLATIARGKASGLLRAERRRRNRELLVCQSRRQWGLGESEVEVFNFEEFRTTLTKREREFFDCELMRSREVAEGAGFSPANRWQLRARVQRKLRRYFSG